MQVDEAEFRKRLLKHCLWLANSDQDYAKWAAKEFERQSAGVLEGLHARVVQTIDRKLRELNPPIHGENDAL